MANFVVLVFAVALCIQHQSLALGSLPRIREKRQSSPVTCTQPLFTGVVSETATPGTFILRVSATSSNNAPLTYSIPDTTLQRFTINPATGDVTTTAQLARKGVPRSALEFLVRATETTNANNFCQSTVRVNILTVTGPVSTTTGSGLFSQSSYSFTVSSCTSGSTVGQVFATSTSGGFNTYSISGGSSLYTINPTTGIITVLTPTSGTQTFTVTAQSSTGQVSTVPVTVTSNCGGSGTGGLTPGQASYSFTLSSCAIGQTVGNVFATSSTGGFVTYTTTGSQFFTVNPSTGQISTVAIPPVGTQTLSIQASSNTGQTIIIPVTIFSSCSGTGTGGFGFPTFGQSSYFFIASSCTPNFPVGQVFATASGATVTYQLVGGNNFFSINPSTGQITLLGIPPTGTQTLTVQAFSSSGQTATVPVSVSVTCSGTGTGGLIPTFQQPSYSFTASACTSGATVGTVFVSNVAGVIYSIDGGSPFYTINPTTGVITVTNTPPSGTQTLSVRAQANGLSSAIPVLVTSSCSGASSGTGIFFQQQAYTFTLSSCTSGTTVGQVFATTSNGVISSYAISGGIGQFSINPTSGLITVVSPTAGTSTFTVTATSTTGQTASVPVTITSSCSGTGGTGSVFFQQGNYFFTATSCLQGSPAGQVLATSQTGGTVFYTLSGGNGAFTVNPTTGQITATGNQVSGTTTFAITAQSSNGGQASTQVTISATCSSVGGTLGFGQSSYSFSATSCTPGSFVGQVNVLNNPSGGTLTYSIVGGNTGQYNINPQTGQITVASTPFTGQTATLTVQAISAAGQSSSVPVSISANCGGVGGIGGGGTVLTSARGLPIFSQSSYTCTVQCSATERQRACVIQARNLVSDSMNYILTPSNLFYVDPNSGEVLTTSPLRTAGTYTLVATASDPYGATATVPVTVTQASSC